MPEPLRILYLVHDLTDPAVIRRVSMLKQGGAHVEVAGFRRSEEIPDDVAGCTVIDLGLTRNGQFTHRIRAVIRQLLKLRRIQHLFLDADVIIARNLEMLAIGARGLSLCRAAGTKKPVLIYESLDIHRLLLRNDPVGTMLRALEGALSRGASALITSSPAFIQHYFETRSRVRLPTLLIENKVFSAHAPEHGYHPPLASPPWVIGWFGAIRCKKSLTVLRELVSRSDGSIRVVIRGRPSYDQFDNFDRLTSDLPGLTFLGPYKNPDDLAAMYRSCHFTWAIDMFEEGQNSSWLLPNRLYEGCLYGAVPLAQQGVETAQRMQALGVGISLPEISAEALLTFFGSLSQAQYQALHSAVAQKDVGSWWFGQDACDRLVRWLSELRSGQVRTPFPHPVEIL